MTTQQIASLSYLRNRYPVSLPDSEARIARDDRAFYVECGDLRDPDFDGAWTIYPDGGILTHGGGDLGYSKFYPTPRDLRRHA